MQTIDDVLEFVGDSTFAESQYGPVYVTISRQWGGTFEIVLNVSDEWVSRSIEAGRIVQRLYRATHDIREYDFADDMETAKVKASALVNKLDPQELEILKLQYTQGEDY
jgi:hypothetical protein